MVEGLLQEPRAIAWVFRGAPLEVVDRGPVELGEDRLLAQERAHRRDDLLVESQDVGLDRLDPRVHGRVAAQLLPEVVGVDVGRGVHGGKRVGDRGAGRLAVPRGVVVGHAVADGLLQERHDDVTDETPAEQAGNDAVAQ